MDPVPLDLRFETRLSQVTVTAHVAETRCTRKKREATTRKDNSTTTYKKA
jgi:hypothetical protein